jgi:hypothetical protein
VSRLDKCNILKAKHESLKAKEKLPMKARKIHDFSPNADDVNKFKMARHIMQCEESLGIEQSARHTLDELIDMDDIQFLALYTKVESAHEQAKEEEATREYFAYYQDKLEESFEKPTEDNSYNLDSLEDSDAEEAFSDGEEEDEDDEDVVFSGRGL